MSQGQMFNLANSLRVTVHLANEENTRPQSRGDVESQTKIRGEYVPSSTYAMDSPHLYVDVPPNKDLPTSAARTSGTDFIPSIPSISLSKWKLTNYSSPLYSKNETPHKTTASTRRTETHAYEELNPDSDQASDASFPSPFTTSESKSQHPFRIDEEELLAERKLSPLITAAIPDLRAHTISLSTSSPIDGLHEGSLSLIHSPTAEQESTLHPNSMVIPSQSTKSTARKRSKPRLMRIDDAIGISQTDASDKPLKKRSSKNLEMHDSTSSDTSTSNRPTKLKKSARRKLSSRLSSSHSLLDPLKIPSSRSHKSPSRPLSRSQDVSGRTGRQLSNSLKQTNKDTNLLPPPTSLFLPPPGRLRPRLQHSKSSSSLLDRKSASLIPLIQQPAQPQQPVAVSTTDVIDLPPPAKETAAAPVPRRQSWVDPEIVSNRQEVWRTQLQQKDAQLIYLLKREEARISKFRASLESWKLLDARRRETTQILLSICTEHNIPAQSIERMVEYIEECYELLPKHIMTAPLFRTKSEHEAFLESHGILHKVLYDVSFVKEETRTIRRDHKFILQDVIETLENQNRQIVSAIKIKGTREEGAQTDEVAFIGAAKFNYGASAVFLNQGSRQRTQPDGFHHFFGEDLEVADLLDSNAVLNLLHDMPRPKVRPSKYELLKIEIDQRYERAMARLNDYEDEYLRERTTFKREREANEALLESLRQQLLETTNGKKKTLINIQIQKMESTLRQLEQQHQNTINLLVHRIKEAKEENERILKERETVQRQADYYRLAEQSAAMIQSDVVAPTGFVALMFTDVQHSSILWANLGVVMAEALEVHNNVISKIVEETGGYYVKSIGDAFMLSFSKVEKAVECAMRIQLDLLEAEWPEALLEQEDGKEVRDENGTVLFRGLRVRVGIHAGVPISAVDPYTGRTDYFGEQTNISSSVEGCAKFGGQVAVSEPVWEHIEDTMFFKSTGPIHLAECRSHVELKGAKEPMAIRLIVPKKIARREYPKIDMKLDEKYEEMKRNVQRMRLQMDLMRTMLNKKEEETSKRKSASAAQSRDAEITAKLLKEVESMKVIKQEEYNMMQAILAKQNEVNNLEKSILHKEKHKAAKQIQKLERELQNLRVQHMTLLREKSLLEIQNLSNVSKIQELNTRLRKERKDWSEDKDELTGKIEMEREISSIHEANKMRLLTQISDLTDQVEILKAERHEFMLQAEHATVRLKQLRHNIEQMEKSHQQLVKDATVFRTAAHERVNESKISYITQKNEIANLRAYIGAIHQGHKDTLSDISDVNKQLLGDIAKIMHKHNRDNPHLQRYLQEHWSSLHEEKNDTMEERSIYMSPEDEERQIVEVLHQSHAQLRSLQHELHKVATDRETLQQQLHDLNEQYLALQAKHISADTNAFKEISESEMLSFKLPPFIIEGIASDDSFSDFSPTTSGKNSARSTITFASQELHLDVSDLSPQTENPQKKRFGSVPLLFRQGLKSSQSRTLARNSVQNPPGLLVTPKSTTPKAETVRDRHSYLPGSGSPIMSRSTSGTALDSGTPTPRGMNSIEQEKEKFLEFMANFGVG